jgi:hypothetical protein
MFIVNSIYHVIMSNIDIHDNLTLHQNFAFFTTNMTTSVVV